MEESVLKSELNKLSLTVSLNKLSKQSKQHKNERTIMENRFYKSTQEDIIDFQTASSSKNTKLSTNNWTRQFELWTQARGFPTKLESYQPNELNKKLEVFYIELKKTNRKDYEPDSLKVMLAALDRYLRSNNYPSSIRNGQEFASSKKILEGKARMLRKEGLGKRPNKAASLTIDEEESLWHCGQFGFQTPRALQNTLWWNIVQQFGLRGRDNHYNLQIEEFSVEIDENSRRYVKYIEGPSKTRNGGLCFKRTFNFSTYVRNQ